MCVGLSADQHHLTITKKPNPPTTRDQAAATYPTRGDADVFNRDNRSIQPGLQK